MSRRLRSILPSTNRQLLPELVDIKHARENMQSLRDKSKLYFDRNAKPLSPLKPGDRVRYQKGDIWEPAKVISPYNNRSYTIETPDGAEYRRNRKFLIKSRADHLDTEGNENTPCPPQPPVQSSYSQHSQTNSRQHYVTRKGREVRPPSVYTDDEWVK